MLKILTEGFARFAHSPFKALTSADFSVQTRQVKSWRVSLTKVATNRTFIVFLAAALGLLLTFNIAKNVEENQYKERALTVAESVASIPLVADLVEGGDPQHELQTLAERIRHQTGATYIVITDHDGIRFSHPNSLLIGQRIDGLLFALEGKSYTTLNNGTLGTSANGKTPIYNMQGKIVGLVSAGFLISNFSHETTYLRQSFLLYGLGVIILGFFLAEFLSRRLRSRKGQIELTEMRLKYQEREAMLHAIKEGVISFSPQHKVLLINDEACRLLNLSPDVVGKFIQDLLPPSRLLDLLEGEIAQGDDELLLNENFSLRVNHRSVRQLGRDIGSIVTIRDRTEHVDLLREIDSVKNLTDALRGQQHEYANRIHTVTGLLELDRMNEALLYLGEISSIEGNLAETLTNRIANSTIAALLLAKTAIAREKGITLTVHAETPFDDLEIGINAQITIIGNLIDNAIEAATGVEDGAVVISFTQHDKIYKSIEVRDNGHGLPEPDPDIVFEDGFSTKPTATHGHRGHRGLGLAIVNRLVRQAKGSISCINDDGAVFFVKLPVKQSSDD